MSNCKVHIYQVGHPPKEGAKVGDPIGLPWYGGIATLVIGDGDGAGVGACGEGNGPNASRFSTKSNPPVPASARVPVGAPVVSRKFLKVVEIHEEVE